mmetsp:Transcript_121860/g.370526  ORF Transcript_121860/g.370526 Transcript_121860/m.370526 type:complete len:288 (+) Transcript_121860:101-964(+)
MVTAFIHFILVELRPIFVFYTSARGLVLKLAVDAMMTKEFGGDGPVDWSGMKCIKDEAASAKRDCINQALSHAMWRLSYNGTGSDGCNVSDASGFHIVGLFHLCALGVAVLFVVICLALLVSNGAQDFCSGQYLVFTWDLEEQCLYRLGAFLVLAYTVVAICMAFAMSAGRIHGMPISLNPVQLLHLAWTDMALLFFSAIAFLLPSEPAFDWRSPIVERTKFDRSILNLVKQSNDAFGQDLTNAIVRAKLGNPHDLQKLAPSLDLDNLKADHDGAYDGHEETDSEFE